RSPSNVSREDAPLLTVAAVSLLVGFAPGALLGVAMPAGKRRYLAWATAPLLTLGLTAIAMAWLPTLGLPHDAMSVLVAEFGLAGLFAVIGQRTMRRDAPGEPGGRPGWTA